MDAFDELLGQLRSVHEEVCARNAVLEGSPAHLSSQGMLGDPWLPINFWPPRDSPSHDRLPWSTHHTPRNSDVHVISSLSREQKILFQGIEALAKQQQDLGQQITNAVTTCHFREQISPSVAVATRPPENIAGFSKNYEFDPAGRNAPSDVPGGESTRSAPEDALKVLTCQDKSDLIGKEQPIASAIESDLLGKQQSSVSAGKSGSKRISTSSAQSIASAQSMASAHSFASAKPAPQPKYKLQKSCSSTKSWRDTMTTQEADFSVSPTDILVGSQSRTETDTILPGLSRIVHSHRFDMFFDVLTFLNCLLLAFELQYNGMNYGSTTFGMKGSFELAWAEDFLQINDLLFCILFTAELVANLCVRRISFFIQPAVPEDDTEVSFYSKGSEFRVDGVFSQGLSPPDSKWGRCKMVSWEFCRRIDLWGFLDFFVVFFWIFLRVSSAGVLFDPMVLKLARVGKLLRMLKLVKIVSGFDSLYLLTTTIQGSISALAWSVILLFVVQALISFIMCQQLSAYYENKAETIEDRKEIWLYFGTYTRALFTMFELTLANWAPVGRALMDKVSAWFFIFSLVHKFIIGFAIVNVMNGVFMQTTFKIAATDDQIMIRQRATGSRIHREKMSKLFRRGDTDGTGFLTREAFSNLVVDPVFRKWMASMELSIFKEEDVDGVFGLLAGDDDQISLEELVRETSRLKGAARTIDIELRFQEIRDVLASLEKSIRSSRK